MNIYALTAQYESLLAKMQDSEEMSDEDVSALLQADGDLTEKLDNYANVIAELEADSEKLDKEEKRLKARRTLIDKNVDRMKTAVANTLILQGIDKKKTATHTFGFRSSSSVEVKDEHEFIDWCIKYGMDGLLKQTFTLNKTLIKQALENGQEIPAFIVEKKKLQIK